MTKIEELESSIRQLTREELAEFRRWFQDYDADQWDRQIEADINAGKLDQLSERTLADHKAGRTTEI